MQVDMYGRPIPPDLKRTAKSHPHLTWINGGWFDGRMHTREERAAWVADYESADRTQQGTTMAFHVKKGGGDFTPAPAGTHIARCIALIDLGTQTGEYKGKPKTQAKVLIKWELLGEERMDDGQPFVVSQRYTNSDNEKSGLSKILSAWRGRPLEAGFDLTKIVGAYCLLGISHEAKDGKTYVNVTSISPMMKGMEKPAGVNPVLCFNLADPDWDVFGKLGERLQEVIKSSPEYAEALNMQREPGADPVEEEEAF